MDAGCECAPWVRSANPSDSWALVCRPVWSSAVTTADTMQRGYYAALGSTDPRPDPAPVHGSSRKQTSRRITNHSTTPMFTLWSKVTSASDRRNSTQLALHRVQTPGYVPKKHGGFFGYTHLKNPHFYFNLILVYTLYANNNAIFYSVKAFKALSYWVFVLFYLFFLLVQKTQ